MFKVIDFSNFSICVSVYKIENTKKRKRKIVFVIEPPKNSQ